MYTTEETNDNQGGRNKQNNLRRIPFKNTIMKESNLKARWLFVACLREYATD